jgi:ribonuclease HII
MDSPQVIEECTKIVKHSVKQPPLNPYYNADPSVIEIGIDEVGRGPLFGRVYTAAVVLPKDNSFNHMEMKDSKKFHSSKKINEVANYIKEHAIAWCVHYEDEKTIDNINILQATQQSMHASISNILKKYDVSSYDTINLLVDGNYFKPYTYYNTSKHQICQLQHFCVKGGDNTYSSIAAASIIAKVARDAYIDDLCKQHHDLIEKYHIDSNKGYGAKQHIDGIKEHGISIWHRRSFGICKNYV